MKKQKESVVNSPHLPQIQQEYCKILITGSPKYDKKDMLFKLLDKATEQKEKVCVITSTYFTRDPETKKLRGVDHLVSEWSYKSPRSKRLVIFHPEECLTIDDMYIAMVAFSERAIIFSDGKDPRISNVIRIIKEKKRPNHYKVFSI